MEHEIFIAIITATVTGLISTLGTVAALRVHITYLREILRAHDTRISTLESHQLSRLKHEINSQG